MSKYHTLEDDEYMIKLAKMSNLIWIDHHKSAIEECENNDGFVPFDQNTEIGIGACQLTWEYCFDKSIPGSVKLLSEYDVWYHEDERTLPFQYGMRLYNTIPDDNMEFWESVFYELPQKILSDGHVVQKYIEQDNKKYCGACAFETTLDNLKFIAINRMLTNSQMFDSVWDNTKYDAMLTFGWYKDKWTCSLYTDKEGVDVSIVAKNRGGGGHKQAAGFQCDILSFI